MSDSHCEPCLDGRITPSPTSSSCYCRAGTFEDSSNGTCVMCQPGMYCGGSEPVQCPAHSTSALGAVTRSDCVCQDGFYGALANPGSECKPKPLGFTCSTTNCTCAYGWDPIYNQSADGLSVTMSCLLSCEQGQYAKIDAATSAKVDFFFFFAL